MTQMYLNVNRVLLLLCLIGFSSCISDKLEPDAKVLEIITEDLPSNDIKILLDVNNEDYFFGDLSRDFAADWKVNLNEPCFTAYETDSLQLYFQTRGYEVDIGVFDLTSRNFEPLRRNRQMYLRFSKIYCDEDNHKCALFAGYIMSGLSASGYCFLFEKKGQKLVLIDWTGSIS